MTAKPQLLIAVRRGRAATTEGWRNTPKVAWYELFANRYYRILNHGRANVYTEGFQQGFTSRLPRRSCELFPGIAFSIRPKRTWLSANHDIRGGCGGAV